MERRKATRAARQPGELLRSRRCPEATSDQAKTMQTIEQSVGLDQQNTPSSISGDAVIPMAALLALLMPSSAAVGFAVKGLDGRYQLSNQAIERLLGRSNLAGHRETDFLPEEVCHLLRDCDRQILAGASAASVEVRLASAERALAWFELAVVGADRGLKAIASLALEEALPESGSARLQEALDRVQETNRQLHRTIAELERAASTDTLTGAWNRRRLEECVLNEIDRLRRYHHPLCVLILDVDHFKQINDTYGHAAGDGVLQELAALLKSRLRAADSLARWGGEEFVVLCPNTRRSTAALLAERLRRLIAQASFPVVGKVTASIGVAECLPGESWEQWFQRCDAALYRAKTGGRNQVQVSPETPEASDIDPAVFAGFVQLIWHSAYECGNEVVDHGHRQLFADANELLAAMLSRAQAAVVDRIVDELLRHLVQHFEDEQAAFLAAGYGDAESHIAQHRLLLERALALVEAYRSEQRGIGDVFQFFAYDVITHHMFGADRRFFACVRAAERAKRRAHASAGDPAAER